MRLIDADELYRSIRIQMNSCDEDYGRALLNIALKVSNAEEVKAIPLDKPFCKMVYGDYVVYNKKWLVNHLQTEWNILQGKEYKPAIPVEWILKWACGFIDPNSEGYKMAMELVHDWEKENDKDSE